MKLENLVNHYDLVYLERYVNERKYAEYANFSEVSPQYHPIEGKHSFNIGYKDLDPEEIWYAGNSLVHDIAGAQKAGMAGIWYNRYAESESTEVQPEAEIHHWDELASLLADGR